MGLIPPSHLQKVIEMLFKGYWNEAHWHNIGKYTRITEWSWLERTLKIPQFQVSRDTFHWTTLLKALSNLAMNASRVGHPQRLWAIHFSASSPSE